MPYGWSLNPGHWGTPLSKTRGFYRRRAVRRSWLRPAGPLLLVAPHLWISVLACAGALGPSLLCALPTLPFERRKFSCVKRLRGGAFWRVGGRGCAFCDQGDGQGLSVLQSGPRWLDRVFLPRSGPQLFGLSVGGVSTEGLASRAPFRLA